jgi:SAM-dependent methyltransferase
MDFIRHISKELKMPESTQTTTIVRQKRFRNWHGQHWEDRKAVNEWKQKRYEMVLGFVSSLSLEHPHILEIGCGPAWYMDRLAQFGKVVGIDLSEEATDRARFRSAEITYIAGNLYDYSLPVGPFDLVVSQEVIDHVEDAPTFLDEVARVLKPGGYLVVSCTNRFVIDQLDERKFPTQPTDHVGRHLDASGLKQLLRRNFRLLQLETIIPMGRGGILRIGNSYRLNDLLGFVISRQFLDRLREQAGLGYQILASAQKRT